MTKDTLEDLMWRKIDGTLSPEEETRLAARLDDDARAREHYAELVRFTELLGAVDEVEPPTALRQRIEDAIDWDRYAARTQSTTPGFFHRFAARWDLRLAVATAAGLVIGVIGYHLVTYVSHVNGPLDNSQFYGTIGRVTDGLKIDLEAVNGTIKFHQDNELAVSRVEISSQREVEVRLRYDGESVRFGAVGDVDSPLQEIAVGQGAIVLKNSGSGEYFAVFHRQDGAIRPLKVTIVSEGVVLMEREIHPGQRGR